MKNQRQLRVGEAVRHALAALFQRGDIPWPKGFAAPLITITEVTISPDLSNATVYFLTMGGQNREETQKVLANMVGYFRHELASAVQLRRVPNLAFQIDTSLEYATKIEQILSNPAVAKDLAKAEPVTIDVEEGF